MGTMVRIGRGDFGSGAMPPSVLGPISVGGELHECHSYGGIMERQRSVSRRAVVSGTSVGVASLVLPRAAMAASEGDEATFFAASAGSLGAFSNLTATDTQQGGSVSLNWTFVPSNNTGSILYLVEYRFDEQGSTWVSGGTTDQQSFVLTGLSNVPYRFRVIASDGTRSSTSDEANPTTPTLAAPGTPTNLSVEPGGSQELVVSWGPATTGGPASTYTVEYRLSSSGPSGAFTSYPPVSASVSSLTLTGLTNDVLYEVRVFATNVISSTTQSSSATQTVSATPLAPPVQSLATPDPKPPVNAVQSTFTAIDVITDRTDDSLEYQYSFDDSTWETMSSWSGNNTFVGLSLIGKSTSEPITLYVRKRERAGQLTVRGKSSVTLRRWQRTYDPGVVYSLVNSSGETRLKSVTVTARGGRGGAGGADGSKTGGKAGVPGQVIATVALASGERLFVSAGRSGATGGSDKTVSFFSSSYSPFKPVGGTVANTADGVTVWAANYRGGSGARCGPRGTSGEGGGGGGASVVARGLAANSAFVIIVAGGAGGGGGAESLPGGDGDVANNGAGGGHTNQTVGQDGEESIGSKDDTGGGGGGGGGAVGGLRGTLNQTGSPNFWGVGDYRKTGNGGSRGSNLVQGTGVTASTNGNASGNDTTGFVTLEYTETTLITAIVVPT
jgi:hypothetical protein